MASDQRIEVIVEDGPEGGPLVDLVRRTALSPCAGRAVTTPMTTASQGTRQGLLSCSQMTIRCATSTASSVTKTK